MFWSNMSDGSAELGITDMNIQKHMKAHEERNKAIYNTINQIMEQYPDKQQTFSEICSAMRKVKKERRL